jgi:putative membrane protein
MFALKTAFAVVSIAACLMTQAQRPSEAAPQAVPKQEPTRGAAPDSTGAKRYGNTMEEVRGGLAGHKKDTSPAAFVHNAAQSSMTEIELADLALARSRSASVRSFAERMLQDHRKSSEELQALAKRKSIPAPAELDTDHLKVKEALRGKSGESFDSAYARQMLADHTAAIALFKEGARSGDSELATFARKTLPTLEAHRRMALELHSGLSLADDKLAR